MLSPFLTQYKTLNRQAFSLAEFSNQHVSADEWILSMRPVDAATPAATAPVSVVSALLAAHPDGEAAGLRRDA